jgi:hypothetical protein
LGIGSLTEPYYWLFILLTSILFVLFSFLLVRLVATLSFKVFCTSRCIPSVREFSQALHWRSWHQPLSQH